jgi:hypothetical protein
MNSVSNIWPGWMEYAKGTCGIVLSLMVVDDFDFIGIPFLPFKTDTKLVVDPNAVLSGSIGD